MKALILSVIAVTAPYSFANEVGIPEVGTQIATTVKEVEVTNLLSNSSEFRECRELYKIEANATQQVRDKNLKAAQDCFKRKITDVKDPKKLERLSEELGLQSYGLVKGKNIGEIQAYLDKKMYKALTGVDLDADLETRMESQKFKNRKNVDQSVFVDLYKTQLSKNALFELSRFCFNDFRSSDPAHSTKTTFGEHWAHLSGKTAEQMLATFTTEATDTGSPSFISKYTDTTDKNVIYEDIFKGLKLDGSSSTIKVSDLSNFFTACGKSIPILCKKFQEGKAKSNLQAGNSVTSDSTISDSSSPSSTNLTGATACLAKARLQELKVAIENTQKTEAEFEKMKADPNHMSGLIDQRRTEIKNFVAGENGAESIDNLTNFTGEDMLGDVSKDTNADDIAKCKQTPELKKCNGLLMSKDDFDVARQQTEIEMTAKREVEIARLKQIYNENRQDLENYLKEKGYFELAKKAKGNISEAELEDAIAKEYEARKVATLSAINKRFSGRQISEGQSNDPSLQGQIDTAAEQSKEERARLAQVVLFNNIVTANLEIYKGTKKVGKNVNAWAKEQSSLENAGVKPGLFANLQTTGSGSSAVGGQDELGGLEFINTMLGKEKDP